jgi:hypothetical protein
MSPVTLKCCLLSFALLPLFPLSASALPAITCHCFTDRSYDPAHPALADPYFLAMTQNTFLAAVFHLDKKEIVLKKQKGTSSDDMWIAYWMASNSGASAEALMQAKQPNESWKDTLAHRGIPGKGLGAGVSRELAAKAPSSRLAEAVVDEILVRHHVIGEAELAAMRKNGASNQEVIIAAVLAAKTGQQARQLQAAVKGGSKTWGSIMKAAKVEPAGMQGEIAAVLRLPRQGY